ncbi:MAG: threonine/serine exporter [Odoribacter splanchnicus]|nr:threonine/serine exporter [Odoribacter splanchnicus]
MNVEFWISVLLDGVAAAIAAIGFAVISNPPRRAVLIAALLAAVGHACRFYLLQRTPFDLTSSTLFASFTIGMLSMMFAKIIHCPAEVFSFPALLPMIPGMYAYKTILGLIRFMKTEDDAVLQLLVAEIFRNGLTTIFVLFALVIGVSLPLFIFYKQSFMMTRLLQIKKRIG